MISVSNLRRALPAAFVLSCVGALAAAEAPSPWLDVPFVRQEKDGCGAASIAMVMQYWQRRQGLPATPSAEYDRIQQALLSRAARGIRASAMTRYLQRNGYSTFAFAGSLDDLKEHLEKGRPLIVALQPGARQPLHFAVVAGIDEEDKIVLLNDPAQRKLLKQDYASFDLEWKAAMRWTLLAVPAAK